MKLVLLSSFLLLAAAQSPKRVWTTAWCGDPRVQLEVQVILNAERRKAVINEARPAPYAANQSALLPTGIAVDPVSQTVFVSDTQMDFVRSIAANGTGAAYAGTPFQPGRVDGGPTSGLLWEPSGLAYETGRARLIIADYNGCAIRAVSSTRYVSTLLGNAAANDCNDTAPVVFPDNQVIPADGVMSIWKPRGLAISEQMDLLVWTEVAASRIISAPLNMIGALRLLADPSQTLSVSPAGPIRRSLLTPRGVVIDSSRRLLYVADASSGSNRIVRLGLAGLPDPVAMDAVIFGGAGTVGADGVAASSALLRGPYGITLTPYGQIIFSEVNYPQGPMQDRIRVVQADGSGFILSVLGRNVTGNVSAFPEAEPYEDQTQFASLTGPRMLTFEPRSRTLYVTDTESARVLAARCVLPAPRSLSGGCAGSGGSASSFAGSAGSAGSSGDGSAAIAALLARPSFVAVETKANAADVTARVWIVDTGNCLVSRPAFWALDLGP